MYIYSKKGWLPIYKTEGELLYKAKQAEGKTFGEIDQSGRIENQRSKGQLGQIVEESFFGYEVNSNSEADFSDIDVELKVTPIKKNKNGSLSAKERLVLNIINYDKEALNTFETSSFWKKNKNLLILFYEWLPEIPRGDYKIIKSLLHKFAEEDLEIIKDDWETIVKKIRSGLAHELSEADTNYLAACTKGANKNSLRSQPFNDIKAMQRAYSFKQSYMTALVRKEINQEDLIRFSNAGELKHKTLYELLLDRFNPYRGMSLGSISQKVDINVNYNSKSFLQEFISKLLGIQRTKLNQIEEFEKANIHLKTVRLEPNEIPKEHMSFKNIDFFDWSKSDWDGSWLKELFDKTKFLFVVFCYKETKKENPERQLFFRGIVLWNMPSYEINGQLQDFWCDIKEILHDGVKLQPIKQKTRTIVRNNLPGPGYNGICHIRPKAKDGSDKTDLPDGQKITKQAFWLDNTYIANIINNYMQ